MRKFHPRPGPRAVSLVILLTVASCAMGRRSHQSHPSPPQSVLAGYQSPHYGSSDQRMELSAEVMTISARSSRSLMSAPGALLGKVFRSAQTTVPAVAQAMTPSTAADPEKLVIEAWIELQTDDVGGTAAAVRAQVEAGGGRVISENITGPAKAASSAALQLRVPPGNAKAFLDWLAGRGVIESRRILASDVSKTLFDQTLALKNLELTMVRLQKLAEREVPMKELIEIETEMTRVRGQIEKLDGEQRWLLDRVDFATITLTLKREGGPIEFSPTARVHPGPHVAMLTLLDPGDRPRSRIGAGVTLHLKRYLTLELDVFPAKDGDTRAVIGTVGSALYSSFLGGGRRRTLNPYLGFRAGGGYLSDERCGVVGGEIGLELFRHRHLLIETSVRALAFLRDDRTDVALHTTLGFVVPF